MTTSTNLRLDDQLCFALYSATNAVTRAYRPLLDAIGLTCSQHLVMLVLWKRDEQPVHEIAARLELAPRAISPILGRLETVGLVTRTQNAPDRRVVTARLTAAGAELERSASAVQRHVVDRTGFCRDELDGLRDELRDLVARVQDDTAMADRADRADRGGAASRGGSA